MRRCLIRSTRCLADERLRLSQALIGCSGARQSRLSSTSTRKWSTPLAKTLGEAITTTGPISVAAYMRQCLTFPDTGYYTASSEGKDQFGQKGDFVTSPEISQIFGELIGLWVVAEWIAQGRKTNGIYLMELGPGRGTLMDDMLRTIRNFKPLADAIDAIYLVEASPSLRQAQHKLLCGDNPLEDIDIGHQSISKYSDNLKIVWCEDVRFVPKESDQTPFIIAHEFFDALPIYLFESVKTQSPAQIRTPTGVHKLDPSATSNVQETSQWRELVVSPTSPYATHDSLNTPKPQRHTPIPDFQLTRSKAATPNSLLLPELSQRYKNLKHIDNAVIEISPESQTFAQDFAVRIGGGENPTTASSSSQPSKNVRTVSPRRTTDIFHKPTPSGAALVIDYGTPSSVPTNSLRGIKQHALVSPLSEPGLVDVSADVDFLALAENALNASLNVEVHGPVDQARFLTAMGIEQRASQIIKRALDRERGGEVGKVGQVGKEDEAKDQRTKESLGDVVKRVESAWKRLVDTGPQGMGKLYQVMAIVPHVPAKEPRRPVGFGGDVRF